MTTFWIFIALVVLVSLMLIWVPHFRQQKLLQAEEAGVRRLTNLELFAERITILEKELSDELLDQTEFNALKKELEISLLQDIKQGEDESLVNKVKPKGILWPSIMTVALLGISGYIYYDLGAYKELALPAQANNPHAGMSSEQIMAQRIQMMEAGVTAEPENSQAWFSLGHAYISVNRFDDAAMAFDKVMELVGTHAELLGPKATALFYKAGQQMTPQVQALIDQALALDPADPSTLLLVGMNAFFNAEYQNAINAWQSILDSDRDDVDRAALMNAIETAQLRIQAESGTMPNDATHQPVATQAKQVTVSVSIAPELMSQVAPEDTLFIFARATSGNKMPLAATKVSAASLPAEIVLDDASAMSADNKLSTAGNVEIIAVLSKHGSVKPQAGDLKGNLTSVTVGENASLVLDTVVQ